MTFGGKERKLYRFLPISVVIRRMAPNWSRVSHQKQEDNETHEADDSAGNDERHSPIAFDKVAGDKGTQDVTNRSVRVPDAENQTYCGMINKPWIYNAIARCPLRHSGFDNYTSFSLSKPVTDCSHYTGPSSGLGKTSYRLWSLSSV